MTIATDLEALKLHVDTAGQVWFVDGEGLAQTAGQSAAEFVSARAFRSAPCVRLIGTHANAQLIVDLYHRKLSGELSSLQVVTPAVCPTERMRRSAQACLFHMRRFYRCPSQGGFHEVTSHDYTTYALALATKDVTHELPDKARVLLEAHPVYAALTFIPHLNMVKVAKLLGLLLDPRWYFSQRSPDRGHKMEAWLGLNPKTQYGVTWRGRRWRHHDRCDLVLNCWKTEPSLTDARGVTKEYGLQPPFIENAVGRRPADFLWRVWASNLDKNKGAVLADLRASAKFVAFLRLTWLAAIYDGSNQVDGGRSLFRARDFFAHFEESEAYDAHVNQQS